MAATVGRPMFAWRPALISPSTGSPISRAIRVHRFPRGRVPIGGELGRAAYLGGLTLRHSVTCVTGHLARGRLQLAPRRVLKAGAAAVGGQARRGAQTITGLTTRHSACGWPGLGPGVPERRDDLAEPGVAAGV